MILGPDDPRAITGKELEEAREYTERFNRDVLGLKPMTAKQKAAKQKLLDDILDMIEDADDPTYMIVRFRQNAEREIIETGLTLAEAQAHCNDPSTSGQGWFDGYERES